MTMETWGHWDHAFIDGIPGKTWKLAHFLLVLNVGNGWVAGGCWDDY